MKTKITPLAFFLGVVILILGGFSFFIVLKLKEEEPVTVPIKTKAANVTYRKLIALNPIAQKLPTPTIEIPNSTSNMTKTEETEPSVTKSAEINQQTPTPINLVTTPLLTPEATTTELAYNNNLTSTKDATEEAGITSSPIKTLPQSGIYSLSLLIFFTATILIFLSFVL